MSLSKMKSVQAAFYSIRSYEGLQYHSQRLWSNWCPPTCEQVRGEIPFILISLLIEFSFPELLSLWWRDSARRILLRGSDTKKMAFLTSRSTDGSRWECWSELRVTFQCHGVRVLSLYWCIHQSQIREIVTQIVMTRWVCLDSS